MTGTVPDFIAAALDEAIRAVDGRDLAARRFDRLWDWWNAFILDSNAAGIERTPEECIEAWQDFRSMSYREVTA